MGLERPFSLKDGVDGALNDLKPCTCCERVDRQDTPIGTSATATVHQPQHVPRHSGQVDTLIKARGQIGRVAFNGAEWINVGRGLTEYPAIDLTQKCGLVIGGATQHDSVKPYAVRSIEMRLGGLEGCYPAIDADRQVRPLPLQSSYERIVQWRHIAIFLGRQSFQPRHPGMDDKGGDPHGCRGIYRRKETDRRVLIIDADATFHGGRHAHGLADRGHAVSDEFRLPHQASPELARLDAVRGAADVEVYLVVPVGLTDPRGFRQLRRIRPTELKCYGVFRLVKPQQPFSIAVQDGRRRHHLGVQQGSTTQGAVKRPAMPVCPVHHGRNGQSTCLIYQVFSYINQCTRGNSCALFYATPRRFSRLFDISLHRFCTRKMASIRRQKSGRWRVQVRRKGRALSETFVRYDDAKVWAVEAEREIDRGESPRKSKISKLTTFGDLIDLHIADMKEVGRAPGRSKDATLKMLKRELGKRKLVELDRDRFIDFGKARAVEGAGPVTLSIDIGMIKLVLQHAAAVHGLRVSVEAIDLARYALKRLSLVGKANERDRRPTEDELTKLIAFFDENPRQLIPMSRIVKFAIATAMRQDEIFRVIWDDLNTRTKMLTIRDRKDPRQKKGNDQRIPLLAVSGYNALALAEEQRTQRGNQDARIFPFNHRSAGTAFTRACRELKIEDLHFHDLRHEGTSRLFEAGFAIQQVALVTGHKDWKMLRRYTHLKPEGLHAVAAALAA